MYRQRQFSTDSLILEIEKLRKTKNEYARCKQAAGISLLRQLVAVAAVLPTRFSDLISNRLQFKAKQAEKKPNFYTNFFTVTTTRYCAIKWRRFDHLD